MTPYPKIRSRRTEAAVTTTEAGRTTGIGAETEAEDSVGGGGEGRDRSFRMGDCFGASFAEVEDLRGVCV